MSKHDSFLGQEVTYNADENSFVNFHSVAFNGLGHHGGGGTPAPTLVVSPGSHLVFNLIWDSSVASLGSQEPAFMNAMIDVARSYEKVFTTPQTELINIKVGWGEVAGQTLPSAALGASEANGYLTDYATVAASLANAGFSLNASNEPTGAQFFISSTEAKNFGLVAPISSDIDGYVGFGTLAGTGYSYNFSSPPGTGHGTGTGPFQFDFQGVAQHEIAEVMGRISMEGQATFNGLATYTPLDLFNFDSPGHLVLSDGFNVNTQVASYFSVDNGVTHLANFNDGYLGGDIADWASYPSPVLSGTGLSGSQDAFDAFSYPGINTDLSSADQIVMETLGLSPTGVPIS
jgi:hypothetical protein